LFYPLTRHENRLILNLEYEYPGLMRQQPEILNLYDIFKATKYDFEVSVELIAPWIVPKQKGVHEMPDHQQTLASLPKPTATPKQWSTTIEVLNAITRTEEFDDALTDYYQSGKLVIAESKSKLPKNAHHFVAILDQTTKLELLACEGDSFKSVKTRRIYTDYHDAYSGNAMVIWIGEPIK
ncbi:hypothetical protein K8I28_02435, partial [bacterium]|nr:hypothetical protein [bacterium]